MLTRGMWRKIGVFERIHTYNVKYTHSVLYKVKIQIYFELLYCIIAVHERKMILTWVDACLLELERSRCEFWRRL